MNKNIKISDFPQIKLSGISYVVQNKSLMYAKGYMFHKEDDGMIWLCDNHGFIPDREAVFGLIEGLKKFVQNERLDEVIYESNDETNRELLESINPNFEHEKSKRNITPGYVYFLKADNGLTKIGATANLNQRTKNLAIALPYEIELVLSIESNDCFLLEEELHERFREQRKRGEWFDLTDRQIKKVGQEYIAGDLK